MSENDPVLGKHYLKEVNDKLWYLSPMFPNESIHVLAKHVKENILDRI